ncbi:MAG: hypothetical protein Q7S76_00745 [bacterium]|nr:hypothetical protein [bacterium]
MAEITEAEARYYLPGLSEEIISQLEAGIDPSLLYADLLKKSPTTWGGGKDIVIAVKLKIFSDTTRVGIRHRITARA